MIDSRPQSSTCPLAHRRGFSFAEVMFAVIIMGIGFIMVAALFPVAIQQTKLTVDESAAAAVARGADAIAKHIATDQFIFNPPNTNTLYAEGPLLVATDLWLGTNDPTITPALKPPVAVAMVGLMPMPTLNAGSSLFARGKVVNFRDDAIYSNATDYPLRETMWAQLQRGSLINQSDPRFGWVILYRRDRTYRDVRNPTSPFPPGPLRIGEPAIVKEDAPFAHVIVIAVQSTQQPTFGAADVSPPTAAPNSIANLQPRPIQVHIIDEKVPTNTTGVDLIQVRDDPSRPGGTGAVVEGAFVVIADDRLTTGPGPTGDIGPHRGKLNGMIVRVGAQRGADTWELVPGSDFTPIDVDGGGPLPLVSELPPVATQFSDAYVVGRSLKNPADPQQGFAGPAMDVAAYSTFVRVN